MIETANSERRDGFSHWLRTGRLPVVRTPDGIELKFNPWHDPDDGRFTFAGTGQHFGADEAAPTNSADGHSPTIVLHNDPALPQIRTKAEADSWRGRTIAKYGKNPKDRAVIEAKYREYLGTLQPQRGSNRAVEFGVGVGQGLYSAGKDTAQGVYALMTDPVGSVRNTRDGVAGMIDSAIAAEDTPARVQVSRAAHAIANASARDVGRAVGSIAGNIALAAVPGAAATKVSALRPARMARPRRTYHMPAIGWAKENHTSKALWVSYNNAAPGARPGLAPTLRRRMPDGSTRPVKFDGIRGDYLIDRKWGIKDLPRARAAALRQSDALAQHSLIAVWEVPDRVIKAKAEAMLRKLHIKNITVRIAKP